MSLSFPSVNCKMWSGEQVVFLLILLLAVAENHGSCDKYKYTIFTDSKSETDSKSVEVFLYSISL